MHYQIYETNAEQNIEKEVLNIVLEVDAQIPEFNNSLNREKLELRLEGKECALVIAYNNGEPIGYKIGYALSAEEFYSWLGAVSPKHRKKGVAASMLSLQEDWVKRHRYKSILVRSMNQFPAMLKMLISNAYLI